MRISVKRTGGFAGLSEQIADLDTDSLDPPRAREIERLVNEAGFFALPAQVPGGEVGADIMIYEITVTAGRRQHTVAFVGDDRPEITPLRRLVEALRR